MSQSINELANVGPQSLSDDHVYTFKPENLSDVTLHYRRATFHMHQYVLTTQSKFFEALLSTERTPCTICSGRSSPSHHRCLSLPGGQIGGIEVKIATILPFFRHLYATIDNSNTEKSVDPEARVVTRWPRHYYLAHVTAVDPAKDEATVDCYEYDAVHSRIFRGVWVGPPESRRKMSSYQPNCWFYSIGLEPHPHYHLADYFQCDKLMRMYGKQLLVILPKCEPRIYVDQAWRILLLTDRYHWPDVRAAAIRICAADSRFGPNSHMPRWRSTASQLKIETMLDVFVAAKSPPQ
jgi:hypothetical protein